MHQPHLHVILLFPTEEMHREPPYPHQAFSHSERGMSWVMSPRRHWSTDALKKEMLRRPGNSVKNHSED